MQGSPDNVIQLNFFDVWWADPEKWINYTDDENTERETEVDAIERIRKLAKALLRGDYRSGLTKFEKDLHDSDLHLMRTKPHLNTPLTRAEYLSIDLHFEYRGRFRAMTPRQILAVLSDINSMIYRHIEIEEARAAFGKRVRELISTSEMSFQRLVEYQARALAAGLSDAEWRDVVVDALVPTRVSIAA